MIYPTVEQISKLTGDRYLITVATAKCARMVTDEYVEQRAAAERMISKKETDKPLFSMIDPEIRDNKAVKTAIRRLMTGEYRILSPEEAAAKHLAEEAARSAEEAMPPETTYTAVPDEGVAGEDRAEKDETAEEPGTDGSEDAPIQ